MVVNGINPRNRTYRERFQCPLQRIVFEAGIGDVGLKVFVNVTILKSLIYFILPNCSSINDLFSTIFS